MMWLVIGISLAIMVLLLASGLEASKPIVQRSTVIRPSDPTCSQPGEMPCWVTVPASPYANLEIISALLILPLGLWLARKAREGSSARVFMALFVLAFQFCLTRAVFELLEERRLDSIYHDVTIVGAENVLRPEQVFVSTSATAFVILSLLALLILIMVYVTNRPQKTLSMPAARLDVWWWLLAAVFWLITLIVDVRPDPYGRIIRFVSDGIAITILVTVVSFVLTLIVGMFGGLGRLSRNRLIAGLTSLYVEVIRGIPLLVQLMWWYFAFPVVVQNVGKSLQIDSLVRYQANPIAMAMIGLVICYAAYMTEIYRAGIQSIPTGQMEAARSQGMGYFQAMRHIILPQAVRVILPPVGNEFIALLKDSSLVSVVAVIDLSRRGREFASAQFIPIQTWMMVALLYLIMTLLSARVVSWVERRTKFER